MKRFQLTLLVALGLMVGMLSAWAQPMRTPFLSSFTFSSPGAATNAIIYDPGSSVLDLATITGDLELYLSAIALVNGKGTGNVTLYFSGSPDNTTWTSTNMTEFNFTFALDGATNASVLHTNIDASAFRYLKLAGISTDDEETAVTNLAVTVYKKRP